MLSHIEVESRLMDEAVARAVALGRPFEEQEVFAPAWELGYELYPALDERFQLYQEGRWQGNGDKKRLIPRLWIVRAESKESDERVAFLDSLRNGDFAIPEVEASIASRRLSVLTTAQVDRETGGLEICTAHDLFGFSLEEALELRELLNSEYPVLYRLANR